jgi:4-hydroxybenzoate polyprenyltransferase
MWVGLRRDTQLFWRITRPGNLLIAAVTFAVATFLSSQRSFSFVADGAFWGELVIIIVIMAAGYWVNDAYDYKIDRINKPQRTVVGPHLSRKKVLSVYFAVNWLAMTASLALPPKFILVNGCAAVSLYLYASYFKRTAVVGNLIVASLTALVVLAGALLYHLKLALLWGMVFAFLITFLREVTKDIEDIRGDLQHGLHTLPILVGIRGAKWVLLVGHVLTIMACWVPVVVHPLMGEPRVAPYAFASLMLVQIPLGYVLVLLRTARRPTDFGPQATVLKAVIAGGLVSLLLLPG